MLVLKAHATTGNNNEHSFKTKEKWKLQINVAIEIQQQHFITSQLSLNPMAPQVHVAALIKLGRPG